MDVLQSLGKGTVSESTFEGCLKEFCTLWHHEENELMALELTKRVMEFRQTADQKKRYYGDLSTKGDDEIPRHQQHMAP